MKVAATIWDGRISPVFDVSREAAIFTIENGAISARSIEAIHALTSARKVEQLLALGVEILICGAISEPFRQALTEQGVRVLGFVAGEVDEVLATFLAGGLPSVAHSMPGCCCGRHRRRHEGNVKPRGRQKF